MMQHNSDTAHVVKAFLPCSVHHALHAQLVARHETWQDWLLKKAQEELEIGAKQPLHGPSDD